MTYRIHLGDLRVRRARAGLLVMGLLASTLVAMQPAQAATVRYVDQNNSHCTNTGVGSQGFPFCSIGAAAKIAVAGDTVQVLTGTYVENVQPTNSGTPGAPITYQAASGATPVVSGQIHGFTVSAKSWIVITGFTVTHTTDYGIYLKNAAHVTLRGNRVTAVGTTDAAGSKQGIYLIGTTDSLIEGNTTDHNSDTGIYLTTGATGNTIRGNLSFANARVYTRAATGIDVRAANNFVDGNVVYGNEDTGIQLYNGANGTVVTRNLSYNNGDHGIDVLNSANSVVIGNSVYKNTTAGINFEGSSGTPASSGATVANNISVDNAMTSTTTKGNIRVDDKSKAGTTLNYDLVNMSAGGVMMTWGTKTYTTLSAFNTASAQEDHGLQADPKWVAPASGDFHVRSASAAIDSADSRPAQQPLTDLDGAARVDDPETTNIGVGPRTFDDRGAFEYQPDQPPVAALTVSPTSGTAPLLVTADASGSTDLDATPIDTYTFDFGDGSDPVGPQAGSTATHTYTAGGNRTVTVTVTDTGGLSATKTAVVQVTSVDNPPTAVLAVNPSSGSAPLDVTADGSGSTDPDATPIDTYTFDFGDGSDPVGPQAGATATHTYTSAGSHDVTMTVTDTGGASSTDHETVIVGNPVVDQVHYSYVTPTSVAFDWRGGPDTIRYGATSEYGESVQAAHPNPLPISSAGPFWEALLTGLAPGTTYHYSIGGSPDSTFQTAPTGAFRFAVEADIGDSLTYPTVGAIQAQIAGDEPDLVLVPGDITYGEAHGQAAVERHFNDVMGWSRTAAYMPAWGNHEWEAPTDDLRNYKGRFVIPNGAGSPGAPSLGCCGEDWGWFDAGGVRFVSYPEPYVGTTWSDWLANADAIMAAAQADPSITYIATYGHRPAYSTGNHPGSASLASILNGLGDRYTKYVLNFNGHSHDYERFAPIHGVTHITTGGGGAALEPPWTSMDPRTAFRAMHMGYMRVDVTPTAITVDAICGPPSSKDDMTCQQGAIIDTVTIAAPGSDRPPTAALTVSPSAGSAPLLVTADASASTDDDATSPIQSYAFNFGDGSPTVGPQAGATADHTYPQVGTYTVTITVTDTGGRPSTTTQTVTVSPAPGDDPPAAALTLTPASGTAPVDVTADASASTDGDVSPIATYRFTWGDTSSSATQAAPTATHTYTIPGTYTVTVTVTDTVGQVSTATATVAVASANSPPVAALSVSPSSGNAPLPVTADASASTDTDANPIASYRFDFGDGSAAVGPQAAATATHTYTTAGSYTVSVRVTDTAGLSSTTTKTVTVAPSSGVNLIGNFGFESNTSGWNNNGRTGITVSRVAGGHSGDWTGVLANTTGTTQADCTLNDSPNWLKTSQAGTYKVGLWVRADTPGALLKLRIREYNGSTLVNTVSAQITLTAAWQQITLNAVTQVVGSTMDYTAYTTNAAPGTCFYADDASVALL